MRARTTAMIGAALALGTTTFGAPAAQGVMAERAVPARVEFVNHSVQGTVYIEGAVAARPGDFHSVDVSGGSEIYLPVAPEGATGVDVAVVDYACPAAVTLATFSPGACTRVGETSAQGEVSAPFTDDVPGRTTRLTASLPAATPGGGEVEVDVTFVVENPSPLVVQQVASDSTYTWTYLNNSAVYGLPRADLAVLTGTVAGILLHGSNARTASAHARWGVARGRAPEAGDIQPPEPGWKLDDGVDTDGSMEAVFSRTGRLSGSPGNYHVFSWYAETAHFSEGVDVVSYRCPDPAAVPPGDPAGAGCVVKDTTSYEGGAAYGRYKVGRSTALP